MRKLILIVILVVSMVTLAWAQDYKTGIGLRGGFSSGLTLKHFVGKKSAFEGIAAINFGLTTGYELTGLYEIHGLAFQVERLNLYFGAGAHIGTYDDSNSKGINIGVDGILGIEYNFNEVPINIGFDWKPMYHIVGLTGFAPEGGALSIRYIF